MSHFTFNQTSHSLIRFCIYGRSRTREISQQLFRAGLFSILLGLFEGELRAENDFAPRFEEIKKAATDEQLYRFLYDLPKGGDLHNHQDGAVWPEWWYRVATDPAKTHGDTFYTRTKILDSSSKISPVMFYITIPKWRYDRLPESAKAEYEPLATLDAATKAKWLDSLWLGDPGDGRDKFFEQIWPRILGMLYSPSVTIELLIENMKHFGAEGVRYIETQNLVFGLGAPTTFYDKDGSPVSLDQMADLYRERLRQSDAMATGVTVRFQAVVLRFTPSAEQGVEDAYAFVDRHRDLWVGINMAGREDNEKGYPARFLSVYRKMMGKYPAISLSIHAGESDEPNHHVRDTLLLGAQRIGHGVNLLSDPETMLAMRADKNLVEVNLISNKLLGYVKSFEEHPFPRFLRFGIPVCLNTDDRGMWGSTMTDEYFVAVKNFNLSWAELTRLGRNSLEYSFVQPNEKQRMIDSYTSAVQRFESRYSGDWKSVVATVNATGSPYAAREFRIKLPLP
jgi:adenosine deaminase CECR1